GTDRMLVNSAADWGRSDPLKTRKTADAMLTAGFDDNAVDQVMWHNPVAFYGQSGRLDLEDVKPDDTALFQGNSIKRGGE
ncbi:hydrolase TatD, partial [Streptomyces sp. NPDC046909]